MINDAKSQIGVTHRLLSTMDAAQLLNVKPCTLEKWRHLGRGPEFHAVGRLVRYRREELERFVESNKKRSTAHGNQHEKHRSE